MKRLISLLIVVLLCGLSAAGQNYKARKARPEPEPLTFSRTFEVPGVEKSDMYVMFKNWNSKECNVDFVGSFFYGFDGKNYKGYFRDLDFGQSYGDLILFFSLQFKDDSLKIDVDDIYVTWDRGKKYVSTLSTGDNKINRNWLWRINHDISVLDQARLRSAECFNIICNSVERFLKEGPPLEFTSIE